MKVLICHGLFNVLNISKHHCSNCVLNSCSGLFLIGKFPGKYHRFPQCFLLAQLSFALLESSLCLGRQISPYSLGKKKIKCNGILENMKVLHI